LTTKGQSYRMRRRNSTTLEEVRQA
jgi:hypothetical protein